MAKTERLYYTDSYLREFEARVIRTSPDPKGARVYLNRTAFYPESGGQPSDHGALAGLAVLDVVDEDGEIAHVLSGPPASEVVEGAIDWTRRFDHMQQHTGQHLLSAAFEKVGAYKTVSFHMGSESSTIDLDSDRVGTRQIEEVEELANGIVFENHPVEITFRAAEETHRLGLRKPTFREGDVRLVEVPGFDLSACGGTHVSQTGAVGIISMRKLDRNKGMLRVEFVCGGRALRRARRDSAILTEAGRLLSAGFESVPELIDKQMEELRETMRSRDKLVGDLAGFEALQLLQNAPATGDCRVVRRLFESEENKKARLVAHAVAKQASSIALIGVKGTPSGLFFAQSPGGKAVMSDLLKQTLAKFGGKGGGTRDFAQGGGLPEEKLEEALAFAQSRLDAVP